MRMRSLVGLMMAGMLLASCQREHNAMTGSYGQGMLSGQVVVADLVNSSPAGVVVSVRGTGMAMTLGDDGRFAFAGVPDGATLDFRRDADGIEAAMQLEQSTGFLTVQLAKSTASKGKRRGVGQGSKDIYEFEGVIRSAAADSIVVFTSHKEEVTIGLVPETVIRKGKTILTPADLQVDWRVHVKARKVADAYVAVQVIVQNTNGDGGDDDPATVREYEGTVVSASATELVVFTSHKEEVTFAITAETVIRKGNTPVDPAAIQPGWRVHVKATANADGTNTASQVIVQNTRVETKIEGTVASVGTSSLVVTTAAGDVTVQTTNSTQIRKGKSKITLADIHVGDRVEVEGTRVDATTISAKKIRVED